MLLSLHVYGVPTGNRYTHLTVVNLIRMVLLNSTCRKVWKRSGLKVTEYLFYLFIYFFVLSNLSRNIKNQKIST